MERIQIGGRHVAGFGVGVSPAVYVLGVNVVPADAPVGSIVKNQPGSPYDTACTKGADGNWTCSNGSTFTTDQLQTISSSTCAAGQTFVRGVAIKGGGSGGGDYFGPGFCVPTNGSKIGDATLMPDGSYHASNGWIRDQEGTWTRPDGTTIAADGTVDLSVKQQFLDTVAAIEQTIAHPLDTTAKGALAIGRGAGTILSNTGQGIATGLVNPTDEKGKSESPTWLYWLGVAAATAVGITLVAPIVREVIATRQFKRVTRPALGPT
jgi:hypothetical protein